MNLRAASVIGYGIVVVACLFLAIRDSLFAVGVLGITVQILAGLLMVWARLTFGSRSFHFAANPTEGGLVTSGPYSFLRHPIYAAIMYFAWAGVLSHSSTANIALGLIVTAGFAIRMYAEEKLVIQQYPEYSAYAARTKRVIPFVI